MGSTLRQYEKPEKPTPLQPALSGPVSRRYLAPFVPAVRLLYEAEEVVMLSRHFSYEVKAHSICSCDTKMDGSVSD